MVYPDTQEDIRELLYMQDRNNINIEYFREGVQMDGIKFVYSNDKEVLIGQDKNKVNSKKCYLDFAVKTIDVTDEVRYRLIKFGNDESFRQITSMFAEHPC